MTSPFFNENQDNKLLVEEELNEAIRIFRKEFRQCDYRNRN